MTEITDRRSAAAERRDARAAAAAPNADGTFTHRQILTILAGLLLGMFLAALDQTVVSTAIRTIADDLHGFDLQAWATTAFLITSTIATPLYGKLSDLYGRRPFYLFAIGVFVVGSALCGTAQSMYQLAAYRALQGIGAGGLMSLALAIIGDIVPPRERSKYQGYFMAVFGTSSVLGPVIGGFLAGQETLLGIAGWRWIFYVNVPLGVLAFVVVMRVLHLPHTRREHRIDWPGALALITCLVPLLIVAEQGRTWGWGSNKALLCYGIGAVGLVAFLLAERIYQDDALLPLRLFGNRTFSVGSVSSVVIGAGMFGGILLLPQYLQIVHGSSPTKAGLEMIPLVLGIMMGSIIAGQTIARTGKYKAFPLIGVVFVAGALFAMSFVIDAGTSYWALVPFMLLVGLGLGFNFQPIILAVQNAVSPREIGVATSSVTFFRQMGGTIGTAVFLSILFTRLPTAIGDQLATAARSSPEAAAQAQQLQQAGTDQLLSNTAGILRYPLLVDPFREGFTSALDLVLLVAACVVAIGFFVLWFLPQLPLRTQSAMQARAEGGGTATGDTAEMETVAKAAGAAAPTSVSPASAPAAGNGVHGNGDGDGAGGERTWAAWSGNGSGPEAGNGRGHRHSADGGAVIGRVLRGDGRPLAGASMTLADMKGQQVDRTSSGEDGEYRLQPSAGGTYLLIASAAHMAPNAALVGVAEGPVRRDIVLSGNAVLRGSVRTADGEPLAGALITLTDGQGDVAASATSAPDGRFELEELFSGTYTLAAQAEGYQPVARTVELGDGATEEQDIVLVGGSRVVGVVRAHRDGRPLPDATVSLLDEEGTVLASTRTGENGRYAFSDLLGGTYTLIASGYAPVATGLRVLGGEEVAQDVVLGDPQ
jgi:EmrB/QacA subfamily drug resistance transporter